MYCYYYDYYYYYHQHLIIFPFTGIDHLIDFVEISDFCFDFYLRHFSSELLRFRVGDATYNALVWKVCRVWSTNSRLLYYFNISLLIFNIYLIFFNLKMTEFYSFDILRVDKNVPSFAGYGICRAMHKEIRQRYFVKMQPKI